MILKKLLTSTAMILATALIASCSSGGSSNSNTTVAVVPPPPPPPPPPPTTGGTNVTVSGKITFDLVPFNTSTNGLDYNAISRAPARGIRVEALDANNTVIDTQVTDGNGDYQLTVPSNTDMRVRARAEMIQTSGAQWNVQVVDNTSSDALYAVTGTVASSGTVDSERNLNAPSGWGGSSYTGTRSAAPFAILNPIYESLQKTAAVDPDVIFPPTDFNWSTRNRAASGSIADGEIGTSSYIGNGEILILGDENRDTDEYDQHVVVHEWGHYFEDQLSRSDSVGGSHSGGQELDPRLAMGEGFGNALSGIMLDDPFYRDSNGAGQNGPDSFSINVEANDASGWYDESTVQSVLFDIYDTEADGNDNLALGLGPIYEVFTSASYVNQPTFTTIFSFLAELSAQQASSAAAIETLAAGRGINSVAANGAGETNRGNVAEAIPVYKQVTVNGPAVRVCSAVADDQFARLTRDTLANKLSTRDYIQFTATAGTHNFTMTRVDGAATATDPDFVVYRNGNVVGRAETGVNNSENDSITLAAGEHVIEAYDFDNLGIPGGGAPGDACYNFTITR